MAVSRQREYLADASGVELTRNPYGLERALAKIALDTEPLEVANRATQHLYFENPIKAATGTSRSLFSTHPPALDRINRLRELTGQPPVPDASLGWIRIAAGAAPARRPARDRPREPAAVAARSGDVLFSGAPTGPRGDPGPGRDSSVGRARD